MTGPTDSRTTGGPLADSRTPLADSYAAGYANGEFDGFGAGYAAGFAAGVEVGGTQLLLGIEHALGGRLPDLLAGLPHVGGWLDYRRRTAYTDDPCPARCNRCSRCIRAAEVARNLARYGQPDRPAPFDRRPTRAARPVRPRAAA